MAAVASLRTLLLAPHCRLPDNLRGSRTHSRTCVMAASDIHKHRYLPRLIRRSRVKQRGKKESPRMAVDRFKYTGAMRKGLVSPRRVVPAEIERPEYAWPASGWPMKTRGFCSKTPEEIEGMRIAGRIAREVLDVAGRAVAVGVTTDEIDAIVHAACIARNAYPSPLNYQKFPKSCCTSVNEVICHGIPDSYALKNGDIINIDVTCYHGGFHGDCSETFLVGDVDEKGKQLVKVTHDAWQEAIRYCKPGQPFNGIGAVIEDYIKPFGYSSNGDYFGHGIGKTFHTEPNIIHVRNDYQGEMEVGDTFTIEPMICEGMPDDYQWPDRWTVTTKDGKRTAQFEHTLVVTTEGVELLTGRLPDSNRFWWEDEDDDKTKV